MCVRVRVDVLTVRVPRYSDYSCWRGYLSVVRFARFPPPPPSLGGSVIGCVAWLQSNYVFIYHSMRLLCIYIYIYIVNFVILFWGSTFIPSRNLDEVFTYNHIWLLCSFEDVIVLRHPWF